MGYRDDVMPDVQYLVLTYVAHLLVCAFGVPIVGPNSGSSRQMCQHYGKWN
jgi:hypothetical protein